MKEEYPTVVSLRDNSIKKKRRKTLETSYYEEYLAEV